MMAAVKQADPGLELHLLVCTEGPLIERAQELGVITKLLPMPPQLAELGDSGLAANGGWGLCGLARRMAGSMPALRTYAGRIRSAIHKLQPDVIHSNGLKTHLLAGLATGRKRPVVWHLHDYCSSRRIVSRLLRYVRRRAVGAVAVSESVADDARKVLPRFSVEVIPNAIDTEHFSPAAGRPASLDDLAGLPAAGEETLRVGLVATFARWKGQDTFLEAVAQLKAGGLSLPVRFYVIGGPIYQTHGSQFSEHELRQAAVERGIADCVGFIPWQPDTVDIYRALDIVVHASTRPEPFGLTIVEAMACARPVIVARAGGAAELFTHDYDAVGVSPGKPEELASAMFELLQTPPRRVSLGIHARETVLGRYSRRRLGAQVSKLYTRMGSS
jgi:glycosyltransferase involved in cell wall biosynthesis